MKLFRNFLLSAALALFALVSPVAQAQNTAVTVTVTNNSPQTILTGGKYLITEIDYISSSTNAGQFKFYDSTAGRTSIVRAAYSAVNSYATNITQVFTNSGGLLITNILPGIYTYTATVAAATNEAPVIFGTAAITASGNNSYDQLAIIPVRGFTVYGVSGTVTVWYRKLYP